MNIPSSDPVVLTLSQRSRRTSSAKGLREAIEEQLAELKVQRQGAAALAALASRSGLQAPP